MNSRNSLPALNEMTTVHAPQDVKCVRNRRDFALLRPGHPPLAACFPLSPLFPATFNALRPLATSGARPVGMNSRNSLPALNEMTTVHAPQDVKCVWRKRDFALLRPRHLTFMSVSTSVLASPEQSGFPVVLFLPKEFLYGPASYHSEAYASFSACLQKRRRSRHGRREHSQFQCRNAG